MSDKDSFLQWKINNGMFGWDHEYAALIDAAHDFGVDTGMADLTALRAENEALRARVAEISGKADRLSFAMVHSLTDEQQEPFSGQFADLQDALVANSSESWLLRKQAEAVSGLAPYAKMMRKWDGKSAAKWIEDQATRLLNQAAELERQPEGGARDA